MAKTWLITGSSRGLGLELAKAALAAGDRVVATARETAALDVLGDGPDLRKVTLDVTSAEAAARAVGEAVAAFGRLDVVVNNAGYANVSSIEDVDEGDFRRQFETNFFGVFHVTRAALPVLRRQRAGHVVQIASIGGRTASPGLASYQSAKFAVEGFSEALALEVKPLGIAVTIVEPGGLRTDWGGSSMRIDPVGADYDAVVGAFGRHVRAGRTEVTRGDPRKAAAAILAIAGAPKPPLRLLLGTDAQFLARLTAERQAAEDAKWEELGASIDADGLPPFADTEVAKMLRAMKA